MVRCSVVHLWTRSDTNVFLQAMSSDASCRSASTITQLVCRYGIPASRGAIPHVLRRIDEYVTPFLCHETFTAACEAGASCSNTLHPFGSRRCRLPHEVDTCTFFGG
jgi:hypothetical protein